MPEVSVYIPSFNVGRYIGRCIEGLLLQTRPPNEIIVVNDGSLDNTLAVASRYPVRVVSHHKNKGLAATRNTGVRESLYEIVAAIDADCVPRLNWLETLLVCLEKTRSVGVGGKLVEVNRVCLPDRWRCLHIPQNLGDDIIVGAPFLSGHNTVFWKTAIEKVGCYNEKLLTNFEDLQISEKLKRAGFVLCYQPKAVVEHIRTDTVHSIVNTWWRHHFFGVHHDIDFRTTAGEIVHLLAREWPFLFRMDLRSSQPDCAFLSFLAVAYSVVSNIRYSLKHCGAQRLYREDQSNCADSATLG